MTYKELLYEAIECLKRNNVEDPSKEAGLLLSWVIGKDLGFIYSHADGLASEDEIKAFRMAVERRGKQEPFSYITGESEFLGLAFEVNPHVLIPRADTEVLAEAALSALGKQPPYFHQPMFRLREKETYSVLDIGTGSGCLAVSLAKNTDSVMIDAADISEEALETARRNAIKHHVEDRITFICCDFLDEDLTLPGRYDLIVSNPPYIPEKDIPSLMESVKNYEPHGALAGGEDGFVFYRALAAKAGSLLNEDGILAVECGFDQASAIAGLFSQKGMATLILKDLSGIDRVVAARMK